MSDDRNEIQPGADAEFPIEDSKPAQTDGRGNVVAWLAIVLSAMALLAVAFIVFDAWWTEDDSEARDNLTRLENLDRRMDRSDAAVGELDARVGQITHPDYSGDIAALRGDIEEQILLLNSLPARVSALESSVASLAGISVGARETFLLAEAEYYLQIANVQLQLANNPHLATLALGMADERVAQLSDPGLTAVRAAIADELAALSVMNKPDLEGATLTLASLARVVESLPLARDKQDAGDPAAVDAEEGGVRRAWNSVKNAMSGMVKVTPPDQAKLTLISPDGEYFLRNNIALQLQAARLALLRGEQAIFEQTLDDTRALLDTWFDADSEQVISAKLTISEIRENVITASAPDISGSLRLLRQYRNLHESAE
jgi:uncharacterized protein HemX